jgi:hypothetical protein
VSDGGGKLAIYCFCWIRFDVPISKLNVLRVGAAVKIKKGL